MHGQNISARIVADSVNPAGVRITSWILHYPRFIHAEFMTHRIFSRNAASSRARPTRKMIEELEKEPATFEYWGSQKPGMQAGEQLTLHEIEVCSRIISDMRHGCINGVRALEFHNLAKQNTNRYLEAFGHITVLATATNHENFFALRAHKDAQPEFQVLAFRMLDLYQRETPVKIPWGDWHVPWFGPMKDAGFIASENDWTRAIKIATARCARLSYLTQDGEHSPEKDIEMHDRLLAAGHLSPFEHCAQACDYDDKRYQISNFDNPKARWDIDFTSYEIHEGLSGWLQYRKTIEGECKSCDLKAVMANKPDWITL